MRRMSQVPAENCGRDFSTQSDHELAEERISMMSYRSVVASRVLSVVSCLLLSGLLSSAATQSPSSQPSAANSSDIAVYFSPKGGCTDAIVREISQARREIKLQAYSFTSPAIAQALGKAAERGVRVTALLDKSQRTEKYTGATYLANHQIPVLIDAKHAIAHNKIIIIDGQTILTGSFNFTQSAEERNAENLLIIRDHPDLVSRYLANFAEHQAHSEPYVKETTVRAE
jgi:phosphatidylserine/phosphatidylglycerophosphate/cardiolipin synthase-like enzyme